MELGQQASVHKRPQRAPGDVPVDFHVDPESGCREAGAMLCQCAQVDRAG
jgi:hypothetical protein